MKTAGLKAFFMLLSILLLFFQGCGSESETAGKTAEVFVSIEPQKYFVDQIAEERFNVSVMVPPGQSPATYEPTPGQISKLGKASAYFTIGVPFEDAFINKIEKNLPGLLMVDTDRDINKRQITGHSHEDEEDSHDGEHSEEETAESPDPHIWMSPLLVKKQAEVIMETLIQIDRSGEDIYRANYQVFSEELDSIDREIRNSLESLKGSIMFVYHPSFGYFADEYGLKQMAIEDAGKEPSPRILEGIIREVKEKGVKVIFVQPEFQSSSIEIISKATGAAVMNVNPLSYDYMDNLRYIVNTLKDVFQEP